MFKPEKEIIKIGDETTKRIVRQFQDTSAIIDFDVHYPSLHPMCGNIMIVNKNQYNRFVKYGINKNNLRITKKC